MIGEFQGEKNISTLVDLLGRRAETQPNNIAYILSGGDSDTEEGKLTYGELDKQSKAIAGKLQKELKAGDRGLLVCHPGAEFFSAFFGCLRAGVVFAPCYPPDPLTLKFDGSMDKLLEIADDCEAKIVISPKEFLELSEMIFLALPQYSKLKKLKWIAGDNIDSSFSKTWRAPEIKNNDLALLRYTTDSSGALKSSKLAYSELPDDIEQIKSLIFPTQNKAEDSTPSSKTSREIQDWLAVKIAGESGVPLKDINIEEAFSSYGLDSGKIVSLVADQEKWLGKKVSPALFYNSPTIQALANNLSGEKIKTIHKRHAPEADGEDIAIIGMSCRFPGADSTEEFWSLLVNGVDALSDIPPERWNIEDFYHPEPATAGKMYARRGGFIRDIEMFDAGFFGISPKEADNMDPQQRLILEVSFEALERAGQKAELLKGSATGVFVGVWSGDYGGNLMSLESIKDINPHTATGNSFSVLSGRLSYQLDLRGPCVTIDTACSSSLVAVHQACRSLKSGECDLALAGGVNLVVNPILNVYFSQLRALSPDGKCKAFDASADGFVRGDGCGMIALKRLSDAARDNDNILAVIRGSAVNQDGRSNGLTAPNGPSQEMVVRLALEEAGVQPHQVDYVETHGTGTALGDPIEALALGTALNKNRSPENPLIIGSAKTNIGHTESAAGIAGLIKSVLSLRHGVIPPNLHFTEPSPYISWDELRLKVPTEPLPWPKTKNKPKIAGVSSFGISGTNAHLILEEAPPPQSVDMETGETPPERPLHTLAISARTDQALLELSRKYAEFAESNPETSLTDICFTANTRRSHFERRLTLAAESVEELAEQLRSFAEGESSSPASEQAIYKRAKTVFVFSGHGSQWLGMGRQLLDKEPVFKEALKRCDRAVRKVVGWSVIEELRADELNSGLDRFDVVQPVLFSVQVSLAALWRSWGVEPEMLVGHSFGEISAACVADILSLEEAARIICHRSRLMARLSGAGVMAAVELSAEESLEWIKDYSSQLSVAVCNSPRMSVISGDPTAMESLAAKLSAENIFCRYIKLDVAAHSHYMDGLRDDFLKALGKIEPQKGSVPICSTVTLKITDGSDMNAAYWARNLRETVRFAQATELLLKKDFGLFVEVSPHPVLVTPIKEALTLSKAKGGVVSSLRRDQDERESMLMSLGALHTLGCPIDWTKLYPQGRLLPLPTYPWQKERCWIEASRAFAPEQALMGESLHPLLGRRLHTATRREETLFESYISPILIPYLADHRVFDNVVFPGTAFLEQALAAGAVYFKTDRLELSDVMIRQALVFPEDKPKQLQLALNILPEVDECEFKIFSLTENPKSERPDWTLHISGKIGIRDQSDASEQVDLSALQARPVKEVSTEDLCQKFSARRLDYGPAFQNARKVWQGASEALGELRLAEELSPDMDNYHLHPALLDAVLQVAVSMALFDSEETYLPIGVENLKFYQRPDASMWCYISADKINAPDQETVKFKELKLFTQDGKPAASMKGLLVKKADLLGLLRDVQPWKNRLYQIDWIAREKKKQNSVMVSEPKRWLILADKQGVGRRVADLLRARSNICALVFSGESYKRNNEYEFAVNPQNPADFEKLLEEFKPDVSGKNLGKSPLHSIVHLWSLDSVAPHKMSLEDLDAAAENGCLSVLFLTQSLLKANFSKLPSLWLVTQKAQAVLSDYSLSIAQSPLWGMGRVMAMERPELSLGMIDLDFGDLDEIAVDLLKEVAIPDNENHTAFRNNRRYVARLAKAQAPTKEKTIAFEPDASYLITGGLGGLGLKTAEWMASRGAKHLALIGRQGLADNNETAREVIRQMEEAGVEVVTAKADVADQTAAADMLKMIKTFMPPLKGIIHTAGLLDDAMLTRLSARQFREVARPKVAGSWNLHNLTMDLTLDFFVCFSSIMSILGYPGQANYAAANAFMDTLAHYRKRLGLAASSINWGPWTETGLAAGLDKINQGRMSRIMESIPPDQGVKIMEQILSMDSPQVGVMSVNWPVYLRRFGSGKTPSLFSEQAQTKTGAQKKSNILEKLQKARENERGDILTKYMQTEIAKVLGLRSSQSPDTQKKFFEMGMDSLMAVELKNILTMDLETALPTTILLEKPTIEELSQYVNKKIWEEKIVAKAETTEYLSSPETLAEIEVEELLEKNYDLSELDNLVEAEIEELFNKELAELNQSLTI